MFKPVIFYLHGFASDANSSKIKILHDNFKKNNVKFFADSYNTYDPVLGHNEINDLVLKNLNTEKEVPIFVGTSLGAYWAYYFAAKYNGHYVIANPSLFPAESLKKYLNDTGKYKNFAGLEFDFTENMLKNYNDYLNFDNDVIPFPKSGHVLMNLGDEIIADSFPVVENLLKDHAEIVYLKGGNHRFENTDALIEKINDIIHYNLEIGINENNV